MPRATAERPADRHHVTATVTVIITVTGQNSMIARRAESAHWG
ncbi:hypothetical protein ACWDG9_39880 [Streptomyces sp. NPDC001073]